MIEDDSYEELLLEEDTDGVSVQDQPSYKQAKRDLARLVYANLGQPHRESPWTLPQNALQAANALLQQIRAALHGGQQGQKLILLNLLDGDGRTDVSASALVVLMQQTSIGWLVDLWQALAMTLRALGGEGQLGAVLAAVVTLCARPKQSLTSKQKNLIKFCFLLGAKDRQHQSRELFGHFAAALPVLMHNPSVEEVKAAITGYVEHHDLMPLLDHGIQITKLPMNICGAIRISFLYNGKFNRNSTFFQALAQLHQLQALTNLEESGLMRGLQEGSAYQHIVKRYPKQYRPAVKQALSRLEQELILSSDDVAMVTEHQRKEMSIPIGLMNALRALKAQP